MTDGQRYIYLPAKNCVRTRVCRMTGNIYQCPALGYIPYKSEVRTWRYAGSVDIAKAINLFLEVKKHV